MRRLTWLEREQFFEIAESRPRTCREWQCYAFDIDHSIYSEIPSPYTENPDEDSFPSPVRRWYGRIDDQLFLIDVFFVICPNECQVWIPFSDSHEFAWQTLQDLQLLPAAIQTNRTSGISNDSKSRIRTVFRHDDRGFDYPIYDGASDDDAESLIHFLRSQDSTIVYSLGEPELSISWVPIESSGASCIHRARYTSRTSTISVGCEMSKESQNDFLIYSESPELDARRYSIRNGIVINML